jgi:outer membrane protein OmpA-like peptidoglycan-associated protein
MRFKIAFMSFAVLILVWANVPFAQEGGLAEQFKKALTPQSSQKSQPVPGKRMRAIGGVKTEPTHEVEGVTKPSLTMHLEFKFNSDELTPQTVKYLDALGTALQDPTLRGYVYKVEGHTDNVGTDAYNLELSRKRALAVVDYMVKTFGLEREQFDVQGFGKKNPVASNDSEEGRQQNRRVVVVNTLKAFQAAAVDKPKLTVKVKYSRAKEERELQDGDTLTQRDNYAIEFTPKTSAYVYIYQVDTMGKMEPLFPNSQFSQSSNLVEPGRLYRLPEFGKWLFLDESKGKEHIVVIAQKGALKDPMRVCQKVMGSEETGPERTALASVNQPGSSARTTGKTRSLGGIRPDQPDATATQTGAGPTKVVPDEGIDMGKIFVWKLSFMHQ